MSLELDFDVDFQEEIVRAFQSFHKLVLFGAGIGGSSVVTFIEKNCPEVKNRILFFIDNNPLKWNTSLMGYTIRKPEEVLKAIDKDTKIIISCGEGDVILSQLSKDYGITEEQVYIPDIAVVKENDKKYIRENLDKFALIYGLMEDKKSKEVFTALLQYKLSHDIKLVSKVADEADDQYFDSQLIKYTREGLFVDCGGYTGDSVESYIRHSNGVYGKIVSFEADKKNADIIRTNYPNVRVVEQAVWNKKTELMFDAIGSGSGKVASSEAISNIITVKANTIDNISAQDKVSFIKMDIEGAEYQALLGAAGVIERDKPTLMISVYHKQDDFLRIPMLILSMNPHYKLYMRHYRRLSAQETVLYAI